MTTSTESLNKLTSFIRDTHEKIIDERDQHPFAQNISTSIAWSVAAMYNSSVYYIHRLNAQLAEAIDNAQTEEDQKAIDDLSKAIEKQENGLDEIAAAYAWASLFTKEEYDRTNTLDPSPENILDFFSKASNDIDTYKPDQHMIDKVIALKKINTNAMTLAIEMKAQQDMEAATNMANWTKNNKKKSSKF